MVNKLKGKIIKGIGGFYYVDTDEGIISTRGRGSIKREKGLLYVGDDVLISKLEKAEEGIEGVIEGILPRKNSLIRPPIANVDKLVIVISATKPKVNLEMLDKFLVVAELEHLPVLIVINKADTGLEADIEKIKAIYGSIYEILDVSGATSRNVEKLEEALKDKCVAFAGPSGVGKSTLINHFSKGQKMDTGDISHKNQRGKHTTRHVEILKGKDYSIYDTPGFTSIDIPQVEEYELADAFIDISKASADCRFDDCKHHKEPDCRVIELVEEGEISQSRYDSYLKFLEELRKNKRY